MRALKQSGISHAIVWLATALWILVLPNVPFWVLGQWHFLDRAVLNLDAALSMLILAVRPAIGWPLLMVAWGVDLLISLSATYHFTKPLEFLLSARFLGSVTIVDFASLTLLFGVAAFGAVVALIVMLRTHVALSTSAATAVIALAVLADVWNGSSGWSSAGTRMVPFNAAGSPTVTLVGQLAARQHRAEMAALPKEETAQGLEDLEAWAMRHPDRGIAFVIVESLGLAVSPSIRSWMEARIIDPELAQSYVVRKEELPFRGATTAAELRHLCALAGDYRDLKGGRAAECLPARLVRLGWQTEGLHGFSGNMFDRASWWAELGLTRRRFVDDPELIAKPRCGAAFRGLCDEGLIHEAISSAQKPRHFTYLLTLNTHLPLEKTDIPDELVRLCFSESVSQDGCQLIHSLGQVLLGLRHAVAAAQVKPLVVIVGDHAPPFSELVTRRGFESDRVPAFVLVPRDSAASASAYP